MKKSEFKSLIKEVIKDVIAEGPEGTKNVSHHLLGLRIERLVIFGPTVPKLKDQIIKIAKKHFPESNLQYFPATNKISGNYAVAKLEFLTRDMKGLDKSIKLEFKPRNLTLIKK